MRITFNADALAEAEEATRWYRDNGGTQPAREFAQELRRVARLAADQPGSALPDSLEQFVCISSVFRTPWFSAFWNHLSR